MLGRCGDEKGMKDANGEYGEEAGGIVKDDLHSDGFAENQGHLAKFDANLGNKTNV